MIFTQLLLGIILTTKLCYNAQQKWFTITLPSAKMIGKVSLRIIGAQNSKDYPNKEVRQERNSNTDQREAGTDTGNVTKNMYVK